MAQPSEQSAERVIVRLPREDRIRDILAAAKDVFCRRGFVDASIGEIATKAGVAQGTIYKFFDSKRDLVLAVLRDWYQGMVATFKADLPAIHGTQNKLRFIVRRHLRSLVDNPDLCRLCANEVRNSGDNYQSEIFDLNREYTQTLIDVCREGISAGELRADLPIYVIRDLIFGGIDHYLSGFLYRNRPLDPDRLVDDLMMVLYGGIESAAKQDSAAAQTVTRLERAVDRLEDFSRHASRRRKGRTSRR